MVQFLFSKDRTSCKIAIYLLSLMFFKLEDMRAEAFYHNTFFYDYLRLTMTVLSSLIKNPKL